MKTYITFITEISAFRQTFRENEIRFPGVYMFMTVASRYLNRPEKLKDNELVRLLKKVRIRSDISDFTKADFNRVYKFIIDNDLNTIEKTRTYFNNVKKGISDEINQPEMDND